MPEPVAQQLRRRALALRELSRSIAASEAIDLRRRAGDDVWIGPTAARCHDDLVAVGRKLLDAADELAHRAAGLEREATELEVAAAAVAAR